MNARTPPLTALPMASERALPPKTGLEEYEIERVLAQSSFSIVYRAYDHVLKLHVAIKEYLPDALAVRGGETQVVLRNRDHAERFQLGAQAFVGEAQTLARCDHPSLVRVLRIVQRHGTYYRVMRYTPGPTLLAFRRETGVAPGAAALRAWLDGLLGALEALHDEGCVHGAVAPGNVLLLPGDKPVLLDFDAVRGTLISDSTQSMMAALEPSFAPPEQQAPGDDQAQGPWSDLYSLAATLRYAIGGELPPPAGLAPAAPLEALGAFWRRLAAVQPGLGEPPGWLGALDACLSEEPSRRPQTVAALRNLFAAGTA
ncbi:MAG: serine/threonine protein kinase, partial [Burkholderiales bacterium]|nr:serine/threonine protein kinase [Burkholderiales bacterium]